MAESLAARVDVLESQMQTLLELPSRVASIEAHMASLDGQFAQFRIDVRDEFSAVRQEMHFLGETLRGEIRASAEALREEITAGDEETRRYMRVLHEKVIARIKVIKEG
jgi:hypothetical protein